MNAYDLSYPFEDLVFFSHVEECGLFKDDSTMRLMNVSEDVQSWL